MAQACQTVSASWEGPLGPVKVQGGTLPLLKDNTTLSASGPLSQVAIPTLNIEVLAPGV